MSVTADRRSLSSVTSGTRVRPLPSEDEAT